MVTHAMAWTISFISIARVSLVHNGGVMIKYQRDLERALVKKRKEIVVEYSVIAVLIIAITVVMLVTMWRV